MAKVKNLGWAKPNDPIYSSGPMIHFRPGVNAVHDEENLPSSSQKHEVTTAEIGIYVVVFDYFNWEAGSCLDSDAPRMAIFAAPGEAETYFDSRVAELTAAMIFESKKVATISLSHWGRSGYTRYCALFKSDVARNEAGWRDLIAETAAQAIFDISKLIVRFDGSQANPAESGFDFEPLEFADVEEQVYGAFSN